jgi:hypothetical protein
LSQISSDVSEEISSQEITLQIKTFNMSEIKLDKRNYRIHGEKNLRLIGKSLSDCGAGRSILIDREDCIIAGNGVYQKAQELRLPVRIIESDGTELIAIKRTDLATEDSRRKALALADNHTSDTSVFDVDLVIEDFSADELDAWEFCVNANIDLNEFFSESSVPKRGEKAQICPHCGKDINKSGQEYENDGNH